MPSSPCLSSDTRCQAFAPHRRCLLPCLCSLCFMEALMTRLSSSTLWQVFHVAGHTPSGSDIHAPPQTPAHTGWVLSRTCMESVSIRCAGILQGHPSHRDLALTSHSKLPCHAPHSIPLNGMETKLLRRKRKRNRRQRSRALPTLVPPESNWWSTLIKITWITSKAPPA